MKKSTFIYKGLLLLVAFITCSFIAENNQFKNSTSLIKNSEVSIPIRTFELLVVYTPGTSFAERVQKRECIRATLQNNNVKGLWYNISSIVPCPSNPYAEVIKFRIFDPKENDKAVADDDDEEKPNGKSTHNYINFSTYNKIFNDCGVSVSTNTNCGSNNNQGGNGFIQLKINDL